MDSSRTAPFREQHDRLLGIAGEISQYLSSTADVENNSNAIRKLLINLDRNLKVHLTLEDTSLYPVLSMAGDEILKNTAVKFKEEMGGIKDVFSLYIDKWSSGFRIREESAAFIEETIPLLDSLKRRIERENTDLYEKIDKMF